MRSNLDFSASMTASLDNLRTELAAVDAADAIISQEFSDAGFADVPIDNPRLAEIRGATEQQRVVSLERAALILGASTAIERVSSLEGQDCSPERTNRQHSLLSQVSDAENALETVRGKLTSAAKFFERNTSRTV